MKKIQFLPCVITTLLVLSSCGTHTTGSTQPINSYESSKAAMTVSDQTNTPEPQKLVDNIPTESFFSYSGYGDDVVTGLVTKGHSYLKVNHNDSGHFAIKGYYSDEKYDLLINTTKPYINGCTYLYPNTSYEFEVNAKGAWTIEAFELGTSSLDTFNCSGDFVSPLFLPTTSVYKITAPGNGHFSVKAYREDGRYDLLVNTTDSYEGKVRISNKNSYTFFVVDSERNITITPEY